MIRRFFALFILLSLLLGLIMLFIYRVETGAAHDMIALQEKANIRLQQKTVSANFRHIVSDLTFVAEHHEVSQIFQPTHDEAKVNLASDFLHFLAQRRLYDQIRFIDANGQELVRINEAKGGAVIVPDALLQNKSQRYYFQDTIALGKGDIYVSPLDLNVEHGEVERPLKPMIRFGMPVFASDTDKIGVVVLNFYGSVFLNEIKTVSEDSPGYPMLINDDGYFLLGKTSDDEWGFMIEERKAKRFGNIFPDAWDTIKTEEAGQVSTPNGMFTFATVYPLLEVKKSVLGPKWSVTVSSGTTRERTYRWKIVSHVPTEVFAETDTIWQRKLSFLFGLFLLLSASGSAMYTRSGVRRRKAEKALQDSERNTRAILNTVGEGIIVAGTDGTIHSTNRVACTTLGYEADELTGRNLDILVPEKSREKHRQGMRDYVDGKRLDIIGTHLELTALRKDGSKFPIELRVDETVIAGGRLLTIAIRDITKRKQAEEALRGIATGIAAVSREDFFKDMVLYLARTLDVTYAFIGEIVEDLSGNKVRIISLCAHGAMTDPFVYDLRDTPCENVATSGICIYPEAVAHLFPRDTLLAEMKIEAYIGAPIRDKSGETTGLLVLLSEKSIRNPEIAESTLAVCADRLATELNRRQAEEEREKLFVQLDNALDEAEVARNKAEQAKAYIENDMKLAQRIQQKLLPQTFPQHEEATFLASYLPCMQIGGDYYDVFDIGNKHIGIFIADASGHGSSAALMVSIVKALLSTFTTDILSPSFVVRQVNKTLADLTPDDSFITLFYGILEVATGNMSYTLAGHPSPFIVNPASGTHRALHRNGGLVGIFKNDTFFDAEYTLVEGDRLVCYTDGLTEATNREKVFFGSERIVKSIMATRGDNMADALKYLFTAFSTHTDGVDLDDDVAILITDFKRTNNGEKTGKTIST